MATSMAALILSVTSLYLNSLRQIDDLSVVFGAPLALSINDAVTSYKSDESGTYTSGNTMELWSDIDLVYVNKGNRNIVVLDAKIIILQPGGEKYLNTNSNDYCEYGYPGQTSLNIIHPATIVKAGEVVPLRVKVNDKDLLDSGSTSSVSLDEKGIVQVAIVPFSKNKGRFLARTCMLFRIASAGSDNGYTEKFVPLIGTYFERDNLRQWRYAISDKDLLRNRKPYILLENSESTLLNLF
ncbi:MAG: hypothetical protein E5W86_03550 [Mesorhizobium sp.]|nr:MAG: hypothetical protein E5W86_03550 [Mesorhizobium sp.]